MVLLGMSLLSGSSRTMIELNKVLYNPFEDNLDDELFLPLVKNAISYDCMIGYFSSSSLKILSNSIYYYLNSNINNKLRLIISPNLSQMDMELLLNFYNGNFDESSLRNLNLTQQLLFKQTLLSLSYLLKHGKIEIKIALPESGLFHLKCWLFRQYDDSQYIVQGSSNHTFNGLSKNFEYLTLHSTNQDLQSKNLCLRIRNDFDLLWENQYPRVLCGSINKKIISALLSNIDEDKLRKSSKRDMANILKNIIQEDEEQEMVKNNENFNIQDLLIDHKPNDLSIPSWINYRTGDYVHQGEAIDAWFQRKEGILSIATGGGKTLTSLIIATLLSQTLEGLLLVIAVPTKSLMMQWEQEVLLFGIQAVNLNNYTDSQKKSEKIQESCKKIKMKSSKVEIIITSHDGLKSNLMTKIEKYSKVINLMMIADEVHNLGSLGFRENPTNFFNYKLGLSATPIRQYDEEGTDFILEFFGGIVYEFGLDQAIGKCLVPFDYFAHVVHLSEEENDEFYELTQKINKLSFAIDAGKDSIEYQNWSKLCIKRRKIIEVAENKIIKFKSILPNKKSEVKNTLIFCSDKDPDQLELVNEILSQRYINFHQITSEETANNQQLKNIIQDYHTGHIQVLTSKRVLDEGFNIPQTKVAHILASNTTKKQWVQRLGRVLRKSEGKTKAEIHDYIVLPSIYDEVVDNDFKNMLKSEIDRIAFFVQYANNGTEKDGVVELLGKLGDMLQN